MARGRTCPQCGMNMFAIEEKYEPAGTWVVYECLNDKCKFRLKQFEDKPKNSNLAFYKQSSQKKSDKK